MNLWDGFGYRNLREQASLSEEAERIFSDLDTTNFEAVLQAVHHARLVDTAIALPAAAIEAVDAAYAEVRDSLFAAVNSAHVGWSSIPEGTFDTIASTINGHSTVFTTNYDLCAYWSHMQAARRIPLKIVDFFWDGSGSFNPANVDVWGNSTTSFFYLHGALHLWQDDDGNNGKWTNNSVGNLSWAQSEYTPASKRRPLFVSEGTSKAKLRTISQSPYLDFCLESLASDEGNTVVFGHSLSEQDNHVVDALVQGRKRKIAVSLYPSGDDDEVVEQKAHIKRVLSKHNVLFFNSTTHPLGDPNLKVRDPGRQTWRVQAPGA